MALGGAESALAALSVIAGLDPVSYGRSIFHQESCVWPERNCYVDLWIEVLHAFGKQAGLPVLYNTSFNLFSDPLVCSPRDAVRSFYSSGIDSMFVGNFLLQK